MIFKPKGFFLNLDKDAADKPVMVAPVAQVAPKAAKAEAPKAVAAPVPPDAASASAPILTTAEAIAAELRRDQENRPAPSVVTFSPERLIPSGALPRARRRAGANLAMFKEMASGMRGR